MDPSHAKISFATSASQQFSRNLPKPVPDPFVEPQGSVAADPGSQKRARPLSPRVQPQTKASMAEPPAKRARRTDSAAMWDGNHRDAKAPEREPKDHKGRGSERDRGGRRDGTRTHGREDRRHRSRSGGGGDRRRLRSRSRDRGETRSRGGERDNKEGREGRERRDRERTASRERHRSRRDDPPPRLDRQRTRSRSPARNGTGTGTRTRSPPRGPRAAEKSKDIRKPATDHKDIKPTPSQPSSKPPTGPKAGSKDTDKMQIDTTNGADADEDAEEAMMRKLMGFGGFKSTKNTKVPGNDVSGIRKEKKTEYRQYMNRVGGFNRPLSPSRE